MKKAVILAALAACVGAQTATFTKLPAQYRFYARDAQDSALVEIAGSAAGADSVVLTVEKNGAQWNRQVRSVTEANAFSFAVKIHAELAEYRFRVFADTMLAADKDSIVCGDAIVIDGQSNAQTMTADTALWTQEWLRTNSWAGSGNYDTFWCVAQCSTYWMRNDWIGGWEARLGKRLVDSLGIPFFVLNRAVGGSAIESHLPGTGTFEGIKNFLTVSGFKNDVRAFFWHQGEGNGADSTLWRTYEMKLDSLVRSWKRELPALERFFMFQIHQGCNWGSDLALLSPGNEHIREIQRVYGTTTPGVCVMSTCGIGGHDGCHYAYRGYNEMGDLIFRQVMRDLYGSTDTSLIDPPDIRRAYYSGPAHEEIVLEFNQPVVWPADTTYYFSWKYIPARMAKHIYLDGDSALIDSGFADPDDPRLVRLRLGAACSAKTVTYTPNKWYNGYVFPGGTMVTYEGPWIRNTRGVGALTFCDFPIGDSADATAVLKPTRDPRAAAQVVAAPNPLNPSTIITVTLPGAEPATLRLLDARGCLVRSWPLNNAGNIVRLIWDGTDSSRKPAASGIYIAQLRVGGKACARKLLLNR